MNVWEELINNRCLVSALVAWALAQALKVPIEYLRFRRLNWWLLFTTGGMPSSHAALIVGAMFSIGLYIGFDSPIFALAVAIAMIVTYDAAGVRREAGKHAEKINLLINEFFSGHPISEKQLKEVIGHTRMQVLVGTLLGFVVPWLIQLVWP